MGGDDSPVAPSSEATPPSFMEEVEESTETQEWQEQEDNPQVRDSGIVFLEYNVSLLLLHVCNMVICLNYLFMATIKLLFGTTFELIALIKNSQIAQQTPCLPKDRENSSCTIIGINRIT